MSIYSFFDSVRTTITGGIPTPPPPVNRPPQMQLEQKIAQIRPVISLEQSVAKLFEYHPRAYLMIPIGNILTESKTDEAYKRVQNIYYATLPSFEYGYCSNIDHFQDELRNYYKIVEDLKTRSVLTIPPDLRIETKLAIMKTSGADDLKKKFAEYEKARILSLPVADHDNHNYNISLNLIFEALPAPSHEELVELLKRIPPRGLPQALHGISFKEGVLSQENLQKAIKEVFDQKSPEFKKIAAQFVRIALNTHSSFLHIHMLGDDLLNHIKFYR